MKIKLELRSSFCEAMHKNKFDKLLKSIILAIGMFEKFFNLNMKLKKEHICKKICL